MKRVIKILGIILMVSIAFNMNAQTTKQEKKEQKVLQKEQKANKSNLYKKTGKDAQKESKKLKKDGWKTLGLPMEKQLEEAWLKQFEKDASGYPRYIVASTQVVANTMSAAQMQAEGALKVRIAGMIASNLGSLVDLKFANGEISQKEASSITKAVENSKILVSQKLGRMLKPFEIFKSLPNNNVVVRMTMVYDMRMAMSMARQVLMEELKKDLEINGEKLDKIMCLDDAMECSRKMIPDEIIE